MANQQNWLRKGDIMKRLCIGLLAGIFAVLNIAHADPAAEVAWVDTVIRKTLVAEGYKDEAGRYRAYVKGLMDQTAGDGWWRDKNGLFRLATVDRWLRQPLTAPVEGDELSRRVHGIVMEKRRGFDLLAVGSELLDLPPPKKETYPDPPKDFDDRDKDLFRMRAYLDACRDHIEAAFKGLTPEELTEAEKESTRLLIDAMGDTRAARMTEEEPGKALLALLNKVDFARLRDAGVQLAAIEKDRALVRRLMKLPAGRYEDIIIGGKGDDTHDLDALEGVACVIDPDGNDTYKGGRTSPERPVLVVIDIAGNDRYTADGPFAQGCGHFGASSFFDREGDDVYEATDAAQGCGFVGIGVLIDREGNDVYRGDRRVQGAGIFGMGVLIDRDGDDSYQAALFAQGHGGPMGIGLLDDLDGKDHYAAGGKYEDNYQEPPGKYRHSWSQGCGSGYRAYCNGGFGILMDGGGDDLYETDYFSTGGYWFAAGISRDFGGNDVRRLLTHNFSRYGLGYGCHFAVGLLYDDKGNDEYYGGLGVEGFGWDIGTGGLYDFRGDDKYNATASGQGHSNQGSWGILYDGGGADTYTGLTGARGQGSTGGMEYHPLPDCGGNFSFLIDRGRGDDEFSCGAESGKMTHRGPEDTPGFLIDTR